MIGDIRKIDIRNQKKLKNGIWKIASSQEVDCAIERYCW